MASSTTEVSVIVTADDLGMSPEVNDAIFDLMGRRRVMSASLLANAPATAQAIQGLARFPHCSFGVHLNITEYEPLTRAPGLAGLLDPTGKLRPLPTGFRFSPAMLQAIYTEFSAQIERLLSKNGPVSHLDSHMHLHLRPALFLVVKAVQRKYGIRAIRRRQNIVDPDQRVSMRSKLKRAVYNWVMGHTCDSVVPEGETDLTAFIAAGRRRQLNFKTVAVLTHPGNPFYPEDYQLLLSPWEQKLSFPIRLISFHQLN